MSKKYKVELTTLAQEQLLQIAEYIRDELLAPDAAKRTLDRLETEISKLDTMPERIVLVDSEPWNSRGIHKYVIGNYIAYFVIVPDATVRVTAVCLGRRDQKKQLELMSSESDEEIEWTRDDIRRAVRISMKYGLGDKPLEEILVEEDKYSLD